MTSAGAWLDAVILVALLATLAVLYRGQEAPLISSRGPALGAASSRLGDLRARLSGYFTTALRQAGLDPGSWRSDFLVIKVLAAVILPFLLIEAEAAAGAGHLGSFALAAGFAVGRQWLLAAALVGFLMPDLWLFFVRRARRRRVEQAVPYFLDLIVAFLHSGLSLIEAFRRAGREGFPGPHPLAYEVALAGRELDAGKVPGDAFRDLATRTGVGDLKAVAAALQTGIRLGASLHETLRAQADALWMKRREAAMRKIHRAEIQVMFPVFLTGLPVFAVLAGFPIMMDLFEVFGDFSGLTPDQVESPSQ